MKKLKVNEKKCIGCGLCVSIAEEVFRLRDDGKVEVIEGYEGIKGIEGKVQEAIDSCPVSVISWQSKN